MDYEIVRSQKIIIMVLVGFVISFFDKYGCQ